MPYKPNVPCRHPGCAALVPVGQKYCDEHKALHARPAEDAATDTSGGKHSIKRVP